jgi:hypothetical protein
MARLTIISISLIAISLILAGQSSAKIDPQSVVAMWLFDERAKQPVLQLSVHSNERLGSSLYNC